MQLEVCLVEDHAALQILHMSLSCLAGARVHGVRNGNVRVGEADGVEVDELLLIFAAGLCSGARSLANRARSVSNITPA